MDAARLATNTTQSFKVDALVVLENGVDASAVAAIEVAKQDVEIGGIFLFRRIQGRWTAVAMIGGGGGSTGCSLAAPIVAMFDSEVRRFGASPSVLPSRFFYLQQEASRLSDNCSIAELFIDGRSVGSLIASQADRQDGAFHFVDDTRPPDPWLSLMTAPGQAGTELAKLYNGTRLEVLHRQPDNWWRVRATDLNLEGWVLTRQGQRVWVHCCR